MASLAVLPFAVCYLRLFVFPATPLLLWGDAPGFAAKGVRLLNGELPYRDFFEFLTPGTDLVYALLFRCFGVSQWMLHLVMAALAALAALWLTWCASRLVRGWFVFLPAVLLTGIVLCHSLDSTHHWFSTVALMGAVWALFDSRSQPRVAAAGAFCGLAASFTQTKGAAAIIALVAYLIWISAREKGRTELWWRRSLMLCASAFVVFAIINGPFILASGVRLWAWDVIVFPTRYFGSVSANNSTGALAQFLGTTGSLKWISFPFQYLVIPLTYIWFFVTLQRTSHTPINQPEPDNQSDQSAQLVLLAVIGLAMLAAVAPALSIRRISTVSPPAVLLLTWLLSRSGRARTALALGAVSTAVALAQIAVIQRPPHRMLNLPVGRVAIPPKADYYDIYRWMAENTKPGQWYFGLSVLELDLGLRNPTPIQGLGPGEYTRPEQVDSIVQGIERVKVPLIVLRPEMYIPIPSYHLPDHLQPFRDYLYLHYRKIESFPSGDEIWQRIDK